MSAGDELLDSALEAVDGESEQHEAQRDVGCGGLGRRHGALVVAGLEGIGETGHGVLLN